VLDPALDAFALRRKLGMGGRRRSLAPPPAPPPEEIRLAITAEAPAASFTASSRGA